MADTKSKIRYAVVGSGWFAQIAVLPSFANAQNAELAAIVSGDPVKRSELGQKYQVPACDYDGFDELLETGKIDAVYIALPNSMHRDYTVAAAKHGVHILCEKPLAPTAAECQDMIEACQEHNVKLMTAYRLHFEPGNLAAIEAVQNGKIGEARLFHSVFTQQVAEGNIRLNADLGSGPLSDLGIYCINAARYLFRDEPIEVTAMHASNGETRFSEVPEMVTASMRFPKERLAVFTCGFGEGQVSEYRVVGTTGDLRMEPAYSFQDDLMMYLTAGGKTTETKYRVSNQVGAEIVYFADCIQNNRTVEPCGHEGLADIQIIEAIQKSARMGGKPVPLDSFVTKTRPTPQQQMTLPKTKKPTLVNAASPSGEK
ncbi:Gfo/Idh/MocA family oxidoreductase [Telmatocola sphagniphila]|uniref:Gfo/Idh/MocA family oxidoreductase n=1 Tax=Telmatocola sphagniphila TaxID=1123043 RepID=A0A8E6B218_9BACT|nr:Gfo/Idh/MocA family oxidoreductase [Telmatocola sphagniphila]QVL29939.1 Gfo/Idh/MocA family oxidoreductase [Telmatocola sphagniphila]